MKILNDDEIRIAEQVLHKQIPNGLRVYGLVFTTNRTQERTWEMVVDAWPDFNVILCRLQTKYTFFCTDAHILANILTRDDVIDWSAFVKFEGFDVSYTPVLKEVCSKRGTSFRYIVSEHALHLPDCASLLSSEHSEVDLRVSSLNDSHAELVNTTWKFGGDEHGYRTIQKMIGNYPSCAIMDDHGQPVSWILVYDFCAMGVLYTLPAHRRKGYAKAVVSCMARKLHAQGFPVYCNVEEENTASYGLFKNLGFIEDPSYRAAWVECDI